VVHVGSRGVGTVGAGVGCIVGTGVGGEVGAGIGGSVGAGVGLFVGSSVWFVSVDVEPAVKGIENKVLSEAPNLPPVAIVNPLFVVTL